MNRVLDAEEGLDLKRELLVELPSNRGFPLATFPL